MADIFLITENIFVVLLSKSSSKCLASKQLLDSSRESFKEDVHIYIHWSNIFRTYDCVMNPPKTQGIVEFHQKSVN